MSATRNCRVRDLKPGMGAYVPRPGRDIRVVRVEIDGDMAMVWLSNDGREPFPCPYQADDEVVVDEVAE
jgi:hypothetical protein